MGTTMKFARNPLTTACDVERRIIDAQSALGKARERSGVLLTALRDGESVSEVYMQNVAYRLRETADLTQKALNLCAYFDRQFLVDD
jgi:hypothetical protein